MLIRFAAAFGVRTRPRVALAIQCRSVHDAALAKGNFTVGKTSLDFSWGTATLQLGGQHGENVEVGAGDVIVIPAGVAHQNIGASDDFGVVGAYPGGRSWDLLRGLSGERPKADDNIVALPMPDKD